MLLKNPGPAEASSTRPWPAERIEHWPIERLIPYANNPRLPRPADRVIARPRCRPQLLAQRGFDYETVQCSVLKFGPMIARRLRRRRPRPSNRWHLACLRQMAGEIFSVMCEPDHLQLPHLVEYLDSSSLRSGRHHKGCASAHHPATDARALSWQAMVPSRSRWVTTGNLGEARGMTCPILLNRSSWVRFS